VKVGRLLRRPTIAVAINLDATASRHLAILAATGKGKSNLLAL
jgi:DNA helicase HerA-like ATPase